MMSSFFWIIRTYCFGVQFALLQVYLGVSKQQIVGVCVAHSINKAFRMEDDDGIDCYSMESYPAK